MKSLLFTNHLTGFKIEASDGTAGKVQDIYFDDGSWHVHYVVVDIGQWWAGRSVLISPISLKKPDWHRRVLQTTLSRAEIENSPLMDTALPVGRAKELLLARYFGWNSFWPEGYVPPLDFDEEVEEKYDPHLRSTRILTGVEVSGEDGSVSGSVQDFVLDPILWTIPYLELRRENGDLLLLDSARIEWIDLSSRRMLVSKLDLKDEESVAEYNPRYTVIVEMFPGEAKK